MQPFEYNDKIKNKIKSMIAENGLNFTTAIEPINKATNIDITRQYFSYKLNKGKLYLNEAMAIADALGYKLEFVPKDN